MKRPLAIVTEDLDPEAASWLAERCEVIHCATDDPAFSDLIGRAAALVVRTYTRVDEAMLSRAPLLKVVGRAGVGLENIDIEACRRRGVRVVHTPDSNTSAVAEYIFALLFDALRPRMYLGTGATPALGPSLQSSSVPDTEEWRRLRRRYVAKRELNELVLGIWGMGRIGQAVARIASGFQMRVIYNDLIEIPPEKRWGGEPVRVEDLLTGSDVLTVHVDERHDNRGLVSADVLAQMKSDVLLINTSRGFVVDAAALAAFLRSNPAAQAILDVHEPEPIEPAYPLLGLENAWLLPHLASGTASAKKRMSWVVRKVWDILSPTE